jgi:glycosyltransferase involved in cell wall biosynthesis
MVGDGELESAVRARARAHGIHERLVLISHLDDLGPLLLEADVFVMTSRYEGLSYAAAEAGARGRPMVLSDVAGLRDLIPDERTGCLVPAGDAALFASRIIELLADPARRAALGREAARRVATTFNAAGMIAATERVYDGLLERRVHAPR